METIKKTNLTVAVTIQSPVEKVWKLWNDPAHIVRWCSASDDWHTTKAENDLREGGDFSFRMEAKDGSSGFDFTGTYSKVEPHRQIEYTLADDRNVQVSFAPAGMGTTITEIFEAEQTNSLEMQQDGWQSILDHFRVYVENTGKLEPLHFEISINARVEKVYSTMLDEKLYTEWTSEFNPTSHFKGSWKKGSKILFLGTDQNGKMGGMVSRIKENIPGKFVSIEHRGIIQDGQEITTGAEVEEWAGALENYTFIPNNDQTILSVDMDASQEWKSYFFDTWPKALNKLKSICET